MEILDLITRILYIIAIVAVIVGPLAAMLLACCQVTGTWDLRHFYGNSRYWAMSILNFRYKEKKAEGLSAREFIRFFNRHYLAKGFWGFWKRLNNEERATFVEILSNPEFIESNLGIDKYTFVDHNRILASWEELKRYYDEQTNPSDNVELY